MSQDSVNSKTLGYFPSHLVLFNFNFKKSIIRVNMISKISIYISPKEIPGHPNRALQGLAFLDGFNPLEFY